MLKDINISYLIGLKPEDAIKYLERKGFVFSWDWRETWQQAHNKAFTVAKVMKLDILQTIRTELQKGLNEGTTFRDFIKQLEPKLKKLGWWGKVKAKDVPGFDPKSNIDPNKEVQLGSPRRLKVIYETNLRTSLSAGRYKQQIEGASTHPFLQYIQIQRPTKRHNHSLLHEKVFMYNDPILKIIYPPNGWGCGCRMISLSKKQLEDQGLKITKGKDIKFTPENGWSYNPGESLFEPDKNKYDDDLNKNL